MKKLAVGSVLSLIGGSLLAGELLDGRELLIPPADIGEKRPVTSRDLVSRRVLGGSGGTGLSVSPDGTRVAFELHQADVTRNAYRVAWFIGSTTLGRLPRNVGDAGDPTLFKAAKPGQAVNGAWTTQKAIWSRDGRWIVYRKKTNGEVQLWRSRVDGVIQEQLTNSKADVENFVWSQDGGSLLFATDASRKLLAEEASKQASTGYIFDYEQEWATMHGRPYRSRYALTAGQPVVWAYDWDSRNERQATQDEISEYSQIVRGKTELSTLEQARGVSRAAKSGHVAWLYPFDSHTSGITAPVRLYASGRDGRDQKVCSVPECAGYMEMQQLTAGLLWSEDASEVYFSRLEGPALSTKVLYGWTPGTKRVRRILGTDEWISDCTPVLLRLICFRQTPDYPRTIIAIDLHAGGIETLVDPNPEFQALRVGHAERIAWKDGANRSTFGFLIKPIGFKAGEKYPLVLAGYLARYTFGGGVGAECPVHELAANGFAALVYERPFDLVEHSRTSDPTKLAVHKWGRDGFDYRAPLSLLEAVIEKLDKEGVVDGSRVGICGFSNGANHTGYALIHSDSFAAAAMAWSEQSPANYFLAGVPGWFRRDIQNQIGFGRPGSRHDWNWQNTSLALNASRVNTPLLISSSDFEHIRALQDVITLTELEKVVEMHVFPDEYHVKWEPQHQLAVYDLNYDWFEFWLRQVESTDPRKERQYLRWRKLRDVQELTSAD